ncbi:MAG: hypothetical protein JSV84_04025, partial [Gemmatimonadota bacterium]
FWADSSYMVLGDNTVTTNMDFFASPFTPVPSDYKLIYTEDGDTSINRVVTPFEIWNVTENTKPDFTVQEHTSARDGRWTDGEPIGLWEPYPFSPTWTINHFARPDTLGIEDIDTIPGPDFHTVPGPGGELDTIWHYMFGDTLPMHTGDEIFIKTQKPIIAGDRFRINTQAYKVETTAHDVLDSIKVVPNPYVVSAEWELNRNIREIHFTHLPSVCDIHIYTLTGEPIRTIHHENETVGWAAWDLLTENRQLVAYGLYIYVVETPDGRTYLGKFAVIQ